jgi:trehalose 6-phosphate phosphatase
MDVLSACLDTLRRAPAGLLTDVDGTISRLAPTPTAAVVDARIRESLGRLARVLRLVAVISGRAALDAQRMVGVDGLVYVGNHGLERLDRGALLWDAAAEPFRPGLARTVRALRQVLANQPGVIVEDKGATASVHYRLSPDPERVGPAIRRLVEDVADGLRITEGKMVVEIRPPVHVSKGTIVRQLVEEHDLTGVVYLGDDRTDVDAFRALRALREADGGSAIRALSVAVAGSETPPEVTAEADAAIPGVAAVGTLMKELAEQLEGGTT